jgi:uroporphyrinogen III methyltransferase/synthase
MAESKVLTMPETGVPSSVGGALRGLTFFNPRADTEASALTLPLQAHGGAVIERPMIAFAPPDSWDAFDRRLAALSARDWIAFTSATGVRFTLRRLTELGRPHADLKIARLAAVGPGTASSLEIARLPVTLVPDKFQGEGLLDALRRQVRRGERIWLPRAADGREALFNGLRAEGLEATATPVYRTAMPTGGLGPVEDDLAQGRIHWLVFTSPSTATNFMRMLPEALFAPVLRGTPERPAPKVACLGEVTALAARELGLPVRLVPPRQDIPGLIDALIARVETGRR